jgi:hypothetical protein
VAVYGFARKSTLDILNSTHHQGVRVALGTFKSTRIENLMCASSLSTLAYRRLLITTKTGIQLKTTNQNKIGGPDDKRPICSESILRNCYIFDQKIHQLYLPLNPLA